MTAAQWAWLANAFIWGIVIGILLAPYSPRYRMRQPARREAEEPREIVVKRTVPSFRHPSRTTEDRYERYRTNSGLYAPVRAGKGSMADEVDKD